MTEAGEPAETSKGGGMKGILAALLGAVVAGGAGFFVTYSGLLPPGDAAPGKAAMDYRFVPLDPVIVSLGPAARSDTLKFTGELEVAPGAEEEVAALRPRILDVLNGYLRAVEESELEDPAALTLLQAQMLRRIQTVVGEGRVRDLLITEFILD